jgi:ribosomal protein L7Ae-like RNA K-turn-binding protein
MATDLIKGMLDLTKHLKAEDISLLVEPLHTFSENIRKRPEVIEKLLDSLRALMEDEEISKGVSNLLKTVGPMTQGLVEILTPDATEGIVKLLEDERTKAGIRDTLSIIDPDLLGNLFPVLGSILGAMLIELTKNDKVKDALANLLQNTGTLAKELNSILLGK